MALFGIDSITKIIDSIKNGIPLWGSHLEDKGEKSTPEPDVHYDYFEEYSGDESWSREPHDGYHDDYYDDDYEGYDPDGEYYHKEYRADDDSCTVTEIGRRGAYDDDDNFSFVMFSEYDDDDY